MLRWPTRSLNLLVVTTQISIPLLLTSWMTSSRPTCSMFPRHSPAFTVVPRLHGRILQAMPREGTISWPQRTSLPWFNTRKSSQTTTRPLHMKTISLCLPVLLDGPPPCRIPRGHAWTKNACWILRIVSAFKRPCELCRCLRGTPTLIIIVHYSQIKLWTWPPSTLLSQPRSPNGSSFRKPQFLSLPWNGKLWTMRVPTRSWRIQSSRMRSNSWRSWSDQWSQMMSGHTMMPSSHRHRWQATLSIPSSCTTCSADLVAGKPSRLIGPCPNFRTAMESQCSLTMLSNSFGWISLLLQKLVLRSHGMHLQLSIGVDASLEFKPMTRRPSPLFGDSRTPWRSSSEERFLDLTASPRTSLKQVETRCFSA